MKQNEYVGLDVFRIVAAFLIVAIHTSPLASYSEMADFVLVRIVARVAVPFFFVTSGFFLIPKYTANAARLWSFVKKAGILYGVAIMLYLPLNIYGGYFNSENLLVVVMKAVVFNGTFYHLWYLPASMFGAVIAWFLVKKCGFTGAFCAAAVLYVVGVFGDSYFGFSQQVPFIKSLYDNLFLFFDYTRNGLFLAPVFFVMGGAIASGKRRLSFKANLAGFAASFALLLFEGLLLYGTGTSRHDSLYFALVPCSYFLCCALLAWRGGKRPLLRSASMILYIIHPMMIVLVRGFAKITHLEAMLIENSLGHFGAVLFLSAAASWLFAAWLERLKRRENKKTALDRAWLEVSLENLTYNANVLQAAMPRDCALMAVVKAQAYGHGAVAVANALQQMGVKAFAVATIDEGIALRCAGIGGEILILGYTPPTRAKELCHYELMQTLIDSAYAQQLLCQKHRLKVHIKIDTGMHRLGFEADFPERVGKMFRMKNLEVCGIYTHLSMAEKRDDAAVAFTHVQINLFYQLLNSLEAQGIKLPKIHIQSSSGLINYPELRCDYARIGIALYGVASAKANETKLKLNLRPVLALKSQVVLLRTLAPGEKAGYDGLFVAERKSKIAILPIGYADGLPRGLSCGKGKALIRGQKVPVIGRICMDQLLVDVTEVACVQIGDIATFIGKDGAEEICAEELAEAAQSITNELLSRLGSRLKTV